MSAPTPAFDCIVVGARCAGAPLAVHLKRAGMRVLLLEAKKLHTDQAFSTHAIQAIGMDLLDELGVGDAIRAVTPQITGIRLEVGGHAFDAPLASGRAMYCPRRSTLDPLLQDAAVAAGVELHEQTRVVGLLREGGRVRGVEALRGAETVRYHARWVVGADGRNSTVARLVGARDYIHHVTERGGYWGYWKKATCWDTDEPYRRFQSVISIEPTARFAFECDGGLLIMGALPSNAEARAWGKHHAAEMRRALLTSPLTAPLAQGEPIAPPVGLLKGRFYFREAVGPGWALVGDAGLHKDPTPGHGITDALRDAKALATALVDGRPEALEVYWRARDVASIPLYFQGIDMGRLAFFNPLNEVVMDGLRNAGSAALERMHEVMARTRSPFELAPPSWVLRWVAGAVLRGRFDVLPHMLSASRFAAQVQRELDARKRLLAQSEQALRNARPATS